MFQRITVDLENDLGIEVPEGQEHSIVTIVPMEHQPAEVIENFQAEAEELGMDESNLNVTRLTPEQKRLFSKIMGIVIVDWNLKDIKGAALPVPEPDDEVSPIWKLSLAALGHLIDKVMTTTEIPLGSDSPSSPVSAQALAQQPRAVRRAIAQAPRRVGT